MGKILEITYSRIISKEFSCFGKARHTRNNAAKLDSFMQDLPQRR